MGRAVRSVDAGSSMSADRRNKQALSRTAGRPIEIAFDAGVSTMATGWRGEGFDSLESVTGPDWPFAVPEDMVMAAGLLPARVVGDG